jgi:DNA adenine methylase
MLNINKIIDCKPFIKWAGGKSQLLSELVKRIPADYASYFEPFLGGGALFFYLQPKKAILTDINQDLMNCYQVIQNNVEPLIQDLRKHRYEEEYYYLTRRIDRLPEYSSWTSIERASRFIFLNKTCYNGLYRVNSKGQYNVPFGRYTNPKIVDAENLRACSQVLQDATLISDSFLGIEGQITADDFVYFDPPYIPLNTTSNFTSYSKGGFDTSMQIALRDLCERLNSRGVRFMVSNSSAPLVRELYQNFKIDFVNASRAINSSGAKRGKIKEVIITNYKR